MANGGRIQYTVGFNVDQSGLNQIKQSLQAIQNASVKDLVNVQGLQNADQRLKEIKHTASEVQGALERSFNSDLGTLNVSKFNQELKKLDVKRIYTDFNQVGVSGQNAFRNITSQVLTTNLQLKQTNKWLDEMATTMTNTIRWGLTSSIWNTMTNAVSQSFNFAKKLDTSLNDIRIVTGKSADEMERFALQANRAAKDLGQSTTAYTNASLIYYQQGLSDEETKARTETTLKAANVTGQSAAEVSEQLTAVWNGYKVNAEEAELYVDKLAAVAATTAADLEELSTGMSKVASAANLMGVDMDQLNAQLATIVSVTRQAPESVGTALKTIYARMGDIEAGIDTETTLGNYTEQMATMGFNVLDANGALRDMGDVIEEIGGKWSTLNREQQVALSQTMAGTRQYNNLLSLFDNWDMYTESLETSAEAAGTLQNQQDTYMESMEAHLKQLSAAGEGVYNALFNAEDLNPILDSLTGVVNLFKNVIDGIGGAQGALLLLGNIGTQVFSKQLASGIATMVSNFQAAKNNAHQLQAEMEILTQYENANINDSRTQNLINMKREILDYDKVITEEERNQANEIIRQTNELYKQQDVLQNKKAQIRDIYNQMTGEVLLFDEGEDSVLSEEQLTVYSKKIEAEVNTITNHLSKAKTEAQKFDQAIQDMNRAEEEYNNDVNSIEKMERFDKAIDKVNESMTEYRDYAREILKENALSAEQRERLTEALTKYKTVANQVANGQAEHTEKVNAAQILQRTYNNILRENSEALKQAQHSLKGMKQEQDNLNNSLKAGEQAWKSYISQVNLKAKAQQIVNFANGLGRVSMTLSSMSRIGDIFKDVNLSAGEKTLQILTAISMTLPGLVSIGSAIGKVTGLTELYNAKKSLSIALKNKDVAVTMAQNAADSIQIVGERTKNYLIEKNNLLLKNEAWARAENLGSMTAEAIQQTINNFLTEKGIKLDSAQGQLLDAEIKKRYANATAMAVENVQMDVQNKKEAVGLTNLGKQISNSFSTFIGLKGGVGIVTNAIAVLAISIVGADVAIKIVNRDMDAAKEEAKTTAESLNILTEAYNMTKTEFEKFQNEISDYQAAKTALDEMVTGTDEWKNAVENVNKQVINLISNYKELAPYIQRNAGGVLSLSDEGMRVAEELERDKLNNKYQQLNAARVRASQAQSKLSIAETKEELEIFGDFGAGGITFSAGVLGGLAGGAALGSTLGPVGAVIGAVIGVIVGGISSVIAEETVNLQEESLREVTEAYSRYGESLFDSKETFTKALENMSQSQVDALWANKESLIELSRSVDANTQAQQAYMQQYVQAALEGNEIYESSKNKQDLEKMVAAATNKNLDTFVDKWADKLGGKTDEEIQKAYAKLMEWETTSIDNQIGNKATYYFSDGTSKTIDDSIARYALAMAEASEDATESLRKFQLAIDTTNQKLNSKGLDNEMLSTFFEGKVGDLSNYTGVEVERLSEIDFTDEEAIARGYKNAQDFEDKIDQAQEDFNRWFSETADKTKAFIGQSRYEALDTVITFEKLSLTANKNLSKAVMDAFKYGGDEGLNALLEMIQNVPEDKMEDFLSLVGNIDFTNANAFNILKKGIEELDLELSNFDGFDTWGQIIEDTIDKNQIFEASIDKIISKLQTVTDILNDLSVGDIISKEEYDALVDSNSNFADFFQALPGGEKYRNIGFDLGGWREVEGTNNALDIAEIYIEELEQQRKLYEYQQKLKNENNNSYSFDLEQIKGQAFDRFFDQMKELEKIAIVRRYGTHGDMFFDGKDKESQLQDIEDFYDRYYNADRAGREKIQQEYLDYIEENWIPVGLTTHNFPLGELNGPDSHISDYIKSGLPLLQDWQGKEDPLILEREKIFSLNREALNNIFSAPYLDILFEQMKNIDPSESMEKYEELYSMMQNFYKEIDAYNNKVFQTERDLKRENEILTQTTSLEELNAVFTRGIGTMDEYLKQYQYLSREMALAAGVEEEQIQLYKDKIDAIDGMTNHMAEAATAQILLTQVGLKDLADNWEDQLSKISNLDEFAPDYINAVDQVAESLSQVFAVEKDFFTDDFIKAHQADITKMVNGDEEAFDRLKDIVTDKVQASLKQDLIKSGRTDLITDFDSLIDQLQGYLDTLSFGEKIDETFSKQMATILRKAGYTSAQIMSIFSSMGITINEDWLKILEIKDLIEKEEYEQIVSLYGNEEQKGTLAYLKDPHPIVSREERIKEAAVNILNSLQSSNTGAIFTGVEDIVDSLINPDKGKESEAEIDRYQRVNTELADIANNLKKIQTAQEHLVGQNLISNLEQQLRLLEQQEAVQKRKLEIAKQEASEIGGQLQAQFGIQFDDNNLISNYLDIAKNLSGDALNELNELVQKYDGVINDTIPNLIAEIQQAAYEKIGLQIEAFDVTINVKLDTAEAERNWAEMRNKLFSDWNLGEDAAAKEIWDSVSTYGDHFQSYIDFSDLANSEAEVRIEKLNRLMAERNQIEKDSVRYNQAKANGTLSSFETTSMYTTVDDRGNFFFDEAAYQENLKEAIDDVYTVVEDIQELGENLNQAWIDTFSNAASAFDNQLSMYEDMEDLFQRSIRLAELTQKSGDFTNITEAYSGRVDNYKEQLTSLAQYVTYFADAYKTAMASGNEEAAAEAYNQYIAYLGKYEDTAEKTITAISEKAKAEFNKAFGQKFSLKFDPSSVAEWGESLVAGSEVFFDPVESSYEIDKLGRKIKKTIDNSMNLTAQKKLNEFREKEMKLLREKDKLSADDVKRSELKFELLQKQIALEEAQNNKNTMRLRKDARGNYTFEFTADEEETEEAQQELSDARYNLWEHNMEGIQDSTQEYYSQLGDFRERINSILIDANITDKDAAIEAATAEFAPHLEQTLNEGYAAIRSQIEDVLGSEGGLDTIAESFGLDGQEFLNRFFGGLSEEDLAAGEYTDEQLQNFMTQLLNIPTEAQEYFSYVAEGNANINTMMQEMANEARRLAEEAQTETNSQMDNVNAILNTTAEKVTGLSTTFETTAGTLGGIATSIGEMITPATELTTRYGELLDKVAAATSAYESTYADFIAKNKHFFEETMPKTESIYSTFGDFAEEVKGLTNSNIVTGIENLTYAINQLASTIEGVNAANSNKIISGSDLGAITTGMWTTKESEMQKQGFSSTGEYYSSALEPVDTWTNGMNVSYVLLAEKESGKKVGWMEESKWEQFDTGGYTGEWGSEGKIAVLHEKELVLNATDTSNILNAVSIARDLTTNLANWVNGLLGNINGNNIIAPDVSSTNSAIDQNVHITAEFPNVTNSHEVEDALKNLVNVASQYAFETRR